MPDHSTTSAVAPTTAPPSPATAPKRKGKGRRRHTVAKVVVSSAAVLALVTALGVVFLYRHLNGNINVEDVTSALGDRPDKVAPEGPKGPLNILVMGSDARDCEGCGLDNEKGADASDTTILFHLSADRTRAYGVSIPRDSIVNRPACGENDEIPAAENVMWNAAFALGGPACTIRQFESLTGVFVDHYVEVNFGGFKDMVNAIGGVPVCIPEDIDDPAHGIHIKAGNPVVLKDAEALNYVRARYTLGDQSDISRLKRQQNFIAAMTNKLVSAGVLTRIDRVVGFLNAATKSLTVDPGLQNVAKIGGLGLQFQDTGLDKIQFITIPNGYYPVDSEFSGRVYWLDQAKTVWKRLSLDKPLTKKLTSSAINAGQPPGSKAPTPTPTAGGSSSTETPSETPSETESPTPTPSPTVSPEKAAEAKANGLCA